MHNVYTDARSAETNVVVDPSLHDTVLKEIMEQGGAPTYSEILKFSESI